MKEFLKSPFNILSIFFAVIGLLLTFYLIMYVMSNPSSLHCSRCCEWEEWCVGYEDLLVPLAPFLLAIISYLLGKIILKKVLK